MRVRRVGWLSAVVVSGALALTPAGTAAAGPRQGPRAPSIAALKADVTATGERLAAAAVAWQRGRQQLDLALQRSLATGRAIDDLQRYGVDARARLNAFAGSLYRTPVSPQLTAVMSGDFHVLGTYRFVERSLNRSSAEQQRALVLLASQAADLTSLRARQEQAATAALALQRRLDDQLGRLQADALASQRRLQAAVAELRRQQAAAAAALFGAPGGPPCTSAVPPDAVNGFLPSSALCPLRSAPGHRLVAAAARAFDAMSTAFQAAVGTRLCVTDSYRDYASQVSVFARKPGLAATPGRSQHGWGRAVDLCGGVQQFGSPAFEWLKANAASFGFVHPDWAEPDGSKPEPWHWEYQGS